jgi:hypothetical protein
MLMVAPDVRACFERLQARWRDPLLTTLTVMLALMLFVLAPLHAAGTIKSENFGLALILVCTAALFVVSGSPLTIVAVLVAIGFAAVAAALRFRHSMLDLYFDATSWMILGVSVGWVVARAVFGPGEVNYHRIMGAILLYLTIGATFVALYTFVTRRRSAVRASDARVMRGRVRGSARLALRSFSLVLMVVLVGSIDV